MNLLNLQIVTPEKKVFEESDIESISVPTENGEITILPGHLAIVTKVVHGEIVVRKKGREESLVTTQGFLTLDKIGNILILADYAIRSAEIEIAQIEKAKKKAEDTMKEKLSERDFIVAEAELRKTLLELKVIQKRKNLKTQV